MALDALAYAKKLQEAGFTARQAEVQAEALHMVLEQAIATRQDMREIESRLRARMDQFEARLAKSRLDTAIARFEARMAEMEARLVFRLGVITFGSVTIVSVYLSILIALVR
jgi:hypothetical protein